MHKVRSFNTKLETEKALEDKKDMKTYTRALASWILKKAKKNGKESIGNNR